MTTVFGTNGSDNLFGTQLNDQIFGLEGNDTLIGSRGNDLLDGGSGFDTVNYNNLGQAITLLPQGVVTKGSLGTDQILNVERIIGAAGQANTIDASSGAGGASLNIDLGANRLTVNNIPTLGSRTFEVQNFVNVLGTPNADTITGNDANNRIDGNDGNDLIIGSRGNDRLDGGTGFDTVDYSNLGQAITLLPQGLISKGNLGTDQILNVERIIGATGQANTIDGSSGTGATSFNIDLGANRLTVNNIPTLGSVTFEVQNFVNVLGTPNADTITGNDASNLINGLDGNDVIFGSGGNDVIFGGNGNDSVFGSASSEFIDGGNDDDTLYGNGGKDILIGGAGNDLIYGGSDNDIILGGTGNDIIYGNGGKDRIFGNDGDDLIYGGSEADTIFGGAGNDTIYANGGGDFIDGGSGFNTIWLGGGEAKVVLSRNEGFDTINNFQLGSTQFMVGSLRNDLSFADSANGVRISAGNDLLAVVANQTTNTFSSNISGIFV